MIYDLQKASMLKRISAFILDAILLVILATFAAWIISVCTGYDGYQETFSAATEKYMAEFGVTQELLAKTTDAMTEEELKLLEDCSAAINADPEAVKAYQMSTNLSVLIATFGLLAAFLVLEFAVPLALRNGQTIGKKIFGIALMHVEGVRIGHVALFIRTVLGKYAVETMPFVMAFLAITVGAGNAVFLLVALALIITEPLVLIISRENAMIHDKMAATVAVDLQSQMIFDSHQALIAYKEKKHAEMVNASPS